MNDLYSVRMRAATGGDHLQGGRHISGAERLVPGSEINAVTAAMLERARKHERGSADFINIVVEKVDASRVLSLPALPVTTIKTETYVEGRLYAQNLLQHIGIAEHVVTQAVGLLTHPVHDMRGAVLFDIHTSERLEQDQERGIRVSHVDIDYQQRSEFLEHLLAGGLYSEHTQEALVLATKVCSASGIVAELCWSDDPGYTAGYVASRKYGYVRFPHLKPPGLPQGGRVFFFDQLQAAPETVVAYLEKQPVLVQPVEHICGPIAWKDYYRKLR